MKTACAILGLTCVLIVETSQADISRLAWLTGCWSADGQDEGSVEQWTAPAGKSMLGVNRAVDQGKTTSFEFMRIIETDSGDLTFFAFPSGHESAYFMLTSVSNTEVIFENPQHDFPQKIIYRLLNTNSLVGRIEGFIGGEIRSVDFPMTRTACDEEFATQ